MKKLLIYGPLSMALIATLAVGIPAAVNAESSGAAPAETAIVDKQGPGQKFMTRAAEILGIDEETLGNAFRQAAQEMRQERHQERLQSAVQNGLITEDDAAEIQEWWDSKPQAMEGFGPFGEQNRFREHRGTGGFGPCQQPAEVTE